MNTHFDNDNTAQQNKALDLNKVELLKRKQKMSGITYSVVMLASLFANFLFAIIVSVVASKLFPMLPVEEGIQELRKYQLYRYSSFAIIPFFLILAVLSIVYIFHTKPVDLGFKSTKAIHFVFVLPIFIGLFFGLSWVNGLFLKAIRYQPADVIPNLDGANFLLATLIIAVLPAVVEEVIFRGIILNGLKGNGMLFACFVNGALFSLFHMNPEQTIYQFICGCIFAYIAIRANSILPTMFLHFLNNFVALLDTKFNFWGSDTAIIQQNRALHIVIIVLSILLLVASVTYLILKDIKAHKVKIVDETEKAEQKLIKKSRFFIYSGAGILSASLMWIVLFISTTLSK